MGLTPTLEYVSGAVSGGGNPNRVHQRITLFRRQLECFKLFFSYRLGPPTSKVSRKSAIARCLIAGRKSGSELFLVAKCVAVNDGTEVTRSGKACTKGLLICRTRH